MVTWGIEKNGHCRESETRVNVWIVCRKKMAIVERWPLVEIGLLLITEKRDLI